ncbi:MAG: hypothetical protein V4537_14540 [Pseudomonadota bacterium]
MAQATLTTCGGDTLTAGIPGQIADLESAQVITRQNSASAAIDFGVAATWATGDADHTCKPQSASTDFVLGITVREPLFAASADGLTTVNYVQYANVPILIDGVIFVQAAEAVRAQDEALSITGGGAGNTAAGALGSRNGGAASSTRLVVPGTTWLDTVASGGIGRVRIKTTGAPRTTT